MSEWLKGLQDMRKRMDSDPAFEAAARATGMPGLADDLRKSADKMINQCKPTAKRKQHGKQT